eukprot:4769020-Pyramimonas_sp.AAC.1
MARPTSAHTHVSELFVVILGLLSGWEVYRYPLSYQAPGVVKRRCGSRRPAYTYEITGEDHLGDSM